LPREETGSSAGRRSRPNSTEASPSGITIASTASIALHSSARLSPTPPTTGAGAKCGRRMGGGGPTPATTTATETTRFQDGMTSLRWGRHWSPERFAAAIRGARTNRSPSEATQWVAHSENRSLPQYSEARKERAKSRLPAGRTKRGSAMTENAIAARESRSDNWPGIETMFNRHSPNVRSGSIASL
jgi:hypothetical protein